MKPTYKMMFNPREPSDAESARWQNFDQLFADYQAIRHRRRQWRSRLYGSALLLGLGLAGWGAWYYLRPTPLPPPESVRSVSPSLSDEQLPSVYRESLSSVSPTVASRHTTTKDPPITASLPRKETPADSGVLVEAQPAGGYPALYNYFATQLRYPAAARRAGVSGSVLVKFTIDTEGAPAQIQVIQGVHPDLDQEAVRLVTEMPVWLPATLGGEPIATEHTMPLMFQLTDP